MLLGYQHRAVSVAHTRPAGQQGVLIAHISVGVNADGADIQLAARGAFVERLDILQNVLKGVPARINQILCQCIKHKGIVRIRRMAKREVCHLRRECAKARVMSMRLIRFDWQSVRALATL